MAMTRQMKVEAKATRTAMVAAEGSAKYGKTRDGRHGLARSKRKPDPYMLSTSPDQLYANGRVMDGAGRQIGTPEGRHRWTDHERREPVVVPTG